MGGEAENAEELTAIDVARPGRLPGRPHALPLEITTRGPADVFAAAASLIQKMIDLINENSADLTKRLK